MLLFLRDTAFRVGSVGEKAEKGLLGVGAVSHNDPGSLAKYPKGYCAKLELCDAAQAVFSGVGFCFCAVVQLFAFLLFQLKKTNGFKSKKQCAAWRGLQKL